MAWFDITYTSPTGTVERWGRINFILYDDIVPKTAKNFRALCTYEEGSGYKGSKFDLIIEGSMALGGNLISGNGCRVKSIWGEKFDDENFVKKHDKPYLLSMVNAGPHANGTQFFITFTSIPRLNDQNVVFGEVAEEASKDILKKMDAKAFELKSPASAITIVDCGTS